MEPIRFNCEFSNCVNGINVYTSGENNSRIDINEKYLPIRDILSELFRNIEHVRDVPHKNDNAEDMFEEYQKYYKLMDKSDNKYYYLWDITVAFECYLVIKMIEEVKDNTSVLSVAFELWNHFGEYLLPDYPYGNIDIFNNVSKYCRQFSEQLLKISYMSVPNANRPVSLLYSDTIHPNITVRTKRSMGVIGRTVEQIINEDRNANKLFHYLRTTRMFEGYSESSGQRKSRFYNIPLDVWYDITQISRKRMLELLAGDIDNIYVMGKHEDCHIVVLRRE